MHAYRALHAAPAPVLSVILSLRRRMTLVPPCACPQVRIVRIFNTYGPRMALDDGRVVSNFVAQALTNQPITVYGEGTQTRSFQFVSDLVAGLVAVMDGPHIGPFNIGNPGERAWQGQGGDQAQAGQGWGGRGGWPGLAWPGLLAGYNRRRTFISTTSPSWGVGGGAHLLQGACRP